MEQKWFPSICVFMRIYLDTHIHVSNLKFMYCIVSGLAVQVDVIRYWTFDSIIIKNSGRVMLVCFILYKCVDVMMAVYVLIQFRIYIYLKHCLHITKQYYVYRRCNTNYINIITHWLLLSYLCISKSYCRITDRYLSRY